MSEQTESSPFTAAYIQQQQRIAELERELAGHLEAKSNFKFELDSILVALKNQLERDMQQASSRIQQLERERDELMAELFKLKFVDGCALTLGAQKLDEKDWQIGELKKERDDLKAQLQSEKMMTQLARTAADDFRQRLEMMVNGMQGNCEQ